MCRPRNDSLPERTVDCVGNENILDLWREEFSSCLADDSQSKRKFKEAMKTSRRSKIIRVTFSEVKDCIRIVSQNKANGLNRIPQQ